MPPSPPPLEIDGLYEGTPLARPHQERSPVDAPYLFDDYQAQTIGGCGSPAADYGCNVCSPCDCGPEWGFAADVLYLQRSDSGGRDIVTQDGTGAVLLNSNGLHFDEEVGGRFAIQRRCGCVAWEAAYFGIDWDTRVSLVGAGNLNTVTGTNDFTQANSVVVDYQSDLDSYELNRWVQASDSLAWMIGGRVVTLDETLALTSSAGMNVGMFGIRTENELYGMQIGYRYARCLAGNFDLFSTGKAGIYYNNAERYVEFTDSNETLRDANGNDNQPAFCGEVDFGARYHVTPCFSLRGGYQLIWIDGVALASEQLRQSAASLNPVPAVDRGTLFAHGFFAGGEYRF